MKRKMQVKAVPSISDYRKNTPNPLSKRRVLNQNENERSSKSAVLNEVCLIKEKHTIVLDTSVLVHDPDSLSRLIKENRIVIPWVVLEELDQLKSKPDIGWDAREVIRKIEIFAQVEQKRFRIEPEPSTKHFKKNLQKEKADHQIIATALSLQSENRGASNIVLMSRDTIVRVLARKMGIVSKDYPFNQVAAIFHPCLKNINVPEEWLLPGEEIFQYQGSEIESLHCNEGVVCWSNPDSNWKDSFAALYKGQFFRRIPDNIQAMGLKPYSLDANGSKKQNGRSVSKNWSQYVALAQVLDPQIKLVFLQGGAGTGKTLIALAGAIEQRKMYTNIVVARPMVHLDDRDEIGYLPGNLEQKMAPWIEPISQAFTYLSGIKPENKELISRLQESKKIIIKPLDYIRGVTYHKCFIVIDEAQNLTPHQIKTIITRAGVDTKLVFTGDLGQIDRKRRLDRKTSGLAYAMTKMKNQEIVGIINFKDTVRSPLASLAAELL